MHGCLACSQRCSLSKWWWQPGLQAHLHDKLPAFREGLFSLLHRNVHDGSIQLLLDLLVGSLAQHLLKGAKGHCDGGRQVDGLGQLAPQPCATTTAMVANHQVQDVETHAGFCDCRKAQHITRINEARLVSFSATILPCVHSNRGPCSHDSNAHMAVLAMNGAVITIVMKMLSRS